MDKCEINAVDLSEIQWPGNGETVSQNYTMLYSSRVKAENGVVVVFRNDIVKPLTKVEFYSDRLMCKTC